MPAAEARIRTDRASRYLTQLCGHLAQLSALGPDHGSRRDHRHRQHEQAAAIRPRRAECTDTGGLIEFDRGRCTLRATADELVLLAEADDEQQLQQLRAAVTARLERIGRRDRLSVTWRVDTA